MRLHIIAQYLSGRVLDLGGYTGDLKLIKPTLDYTVVDSDLDALRIAKERGAKTHCRELEGNLHINETFDVVVCSEVLEHLKNPELLLKQMVKLADAAVISLPNECTIYHRFRALIGLGIDSSGFAPHYHMHFPTIKQSDKLVSKYYDIVKKIYWFHPGKIKFPYKLGVKLANWMPGLFARGTIYLCEHKMEEERWETQK
jgi:hypothetical protein